jgi:hypothetical protein
MHFPVANGTMAIFSRVLLDQILMCPIGLSIFYTYMSIVEGGGFLYLRKKFSDVNSKLLLPFPSVDVFSKSRLISRPFAQITWSGLGFKSSISDSYRFRCKFPFATSSGYSGTSPPLISPTLSYCIRNVYLSMRNSSTTTSQ